MAACRKRWSGQVKLGGFGGFRAHHGQSSAKRIGALRELQLAKRVECCVERHAGDRMQSAGLVERYRSYAAKCVKISRNISDPIGKLVLLEMAQSWLELAERVVGGTETAITGDPAAAADRPPAD
jgi:hypothetical protein